MPTLSDLVLHQVPIVEPSAALDEALFLMEKEPLRMVVLVGDEQYMGVLSPDSLAESLIPDVDRSTLWVGPYVHPTRALEIGTDLLEARRWLDRKGRVAVPVVQGSIYRGVVTRADLD